MQVEVFTGHQHCGITVQPAGANLDAAGIDHDRDVPPQLGGGGTQNANLLTVRRMRAVRKVQPGDTHARTDHRPEHIRRTAGRPDGSD